MWKWIHEKKSKKRVQGTTWKGQMHFPNIHLNQGKYPHSGEDTLNVSTLSGISHISQGYADKPIQSM